MYYIEVWTTQYFILF